MPKRDRQKDRNTFFWMKIPVIILTGLSVSIFPAVVIITQNEFRWYRAVAALILCLICVCAPLAAREITLRSDKKHETHGRTPPTIPDRRQDRAAAAQGTITKATTD